MVVVEKARRYLKEIEEAEQKNAKNDRHEGVQNTFHDWPSSKDALMTQTSFENEDLELLPILANTRLIKLASGGH